MNPAVGLITDEQPQRIFDYEGPIPRTNELVELRLPPDGLPRLFAVTSVRYLTNGPFHSSGVRVVEVEVRGRLI